MPKYCAYAFLLLFCAVTGAAGQDVKAARPDGFDGLTVVQRPSPGPLQYFDLHKKAAQLVGDEHFAEAEPLVDRLVTDYPIDGQNWLLAGRVKRKLGKFNDAANAYRKAIALPGPGVPGSAEYWLAASEAAGGSTERSLDALEHLV